MRVVEFKYKSKSGELDKPIFRCLADKPLIDNKLNPEDVAMIDKIAEALSENEPVVWIWYRWNR